MLLVLCKDWTEYAFVALWSKIKDQVKAYAYTLSKLSPVEQC